MNAVVAGSEDDPLAALTAPLSINVLLAADPLQ